MADFFPDPPVDPVPVIATELRLPPAGVASVVRLLADGATVPFIARYRKEATGNLDEVQIRAVEERHEYLLQLDARRRVVLAEIHSQGRLTDALAETIRACRSKADLEDLYLPFKPKRRTRAMIARERGLEPLADLIWRQPLDGLAPMDAARKFVTVDVPDTDAALAGARDICAERINESPSIRTLTRATYARTGVLRVEKRKAWADKATKFDMYSAFQEKISHIPSHRILAMFRGETEEVLRASIEVDEAPLLASIERAVHVQPRSRWSHELQLAARDAVKRLLAPSIENDLREELKIRADRDAVAVFAQNLRELLLAAPFGARPVIGIDPGQRTGCKCVALDATGKLLAVAHFNLVTGDRSVAEARRTVASLCRSHPPAAIAVGNGTHGRETESFVREIVRSESLDGVLVVSVSESGASVYSASDTAREEFPELDVSIRGAISIARRLQDPLAELVKIDPKNIGVGQYQHDVHQPLLVRTLDGVIESCVTLVGVELNTASASLLARVPGIGPGLARKIVAHRNTHGAFRRRRQLLDVSGLGPRAFEQIAGFLRVRGGEHPLDASAVHPERYALVEHMAKDLGVPMASLVNDAVTVAKIALPRYVAGDVGLYTLQDIVNELQKPGRDPRKTFEPPAFRDDVRTLEDLSIGMLLEGVVTNVAAFGAFVDVGVHQDGLVHISKLADRFVRDPNEVVHVGDKVRVTVLEVDLTRRRISLSAREADRPDRN